MQNKDHIRILIVGAGFAGIEAALSISRMHLKNASITLLSKNTHFEYYPMFYRAVAGKSPLEVCIQLSDIFEDTNVYTVTDEVVSFSFEQRMVIGINGSKYKYDYLILAIGSEVSYFNIPGIEKNSFSFKSINDALRLKNHLHEMFRNHAAARVEDMESALRIVVVGGGASGVELSGELARYTKELAEAHEVKKEHVSIILLEGADRVLPSLPEHVSEKAENRLRELGVHVHVGEKVLSEDVGSIQTDHMKIPSKTIVWTAGVRASHYYSSAFGLQVAKNGRVVVTDELEALGQKNVFVVGDGADTRFAGFAQTAIRDARFVAKVIYARIKGKKKNFVYKPKAVAHALPVGGKWAIVEIGKIVFSGKNGWCVRTLIDLRYFLSILPVKKAFSVWREGEKNCETCVTCLSLEGREDE